MLYGGEWSQAHSLDHDKDIVVFTLVDKIKTHSFKLEIANRATKFTPHICYR